jgi:hypothetical protein
VRRVPKLGGALVTIASGQSIAGGISLDAYFVLWTNEGSGTVAAVGKDGNNFGIVASGQRRPQDVVVQGASAYWTNGGFSGPDGQVMGLDFGSTPVVLANDNSPACITADATYVYWCSNPSASIKRVPRAGGTVEIVASGVEPYDIFLLGGTLFFTDNVNRKISTVPAAGGPVVDLTTGVPTPLGIAADSANVYFTTCPDANPDGALMRVPVGGGSAQTLATGFVCGQGVAIDPSAVYWTSHDGSVFRLEK